LLRANDSVATGLPLANQAGVTSIAAGDVQRAGTRTAFGIRIHLTVVADALVLLPDRPPVLIAPDGRLRFARKLFIGACLTIGGSVVDH